MEPPITFYDKDRHIMQLNRLSPEISKFMDKARRDNIEIRLVFQMNPRMPPEFDIKGKVLKAWYMTRGPGIAEVKITSGVIYGEEINHA